MISAMPRGTASDAMVNSLLPVVVVGMNRSASG